MYNNYNDLIMKSENEEIYLAPELGTISLHLEGNACQMTSPGSGENEGTGDHENEP